MARSRNPGRGVVIVVLVGWAFHFAAASSRAAAWTALRRSASQQHLPGSPLAVNSRGVDGRARRDARGVYAHHHSHEFDGHSPTSGGKRQSADGREQSRRLAEPACLTPEAENEQIVDATLEAAAHAAADHKHDQAKALDTRATSLLNRLQALQALGRRDPQAANGGGHVAERDTGERQAALGGAGAGQGSRTGGRDEHAGRREISFGHSKPFA